MRDYNKDLLNKRFEEFTPEERKELWLSYFSNGHIVEVCSTATLDELCSDSCDAQVCVLTDLDSSIYTDYTQSVYEGLEWAVVNRLVNFDQLFKGGMDRITLGFYPLADSDDYYAEKKQEVWVDGKDGYKQGKYSVIYSREKN